LTSSTLTFEKKGGGVVVEASGVFPGITVGFDTVVAEEVLGTGVETGFVGGTDACGGVVVGTAVVGIVEDAGADVEFDPAQLAVIIPERSMKPRIICTILTCPILDSLSFLKRYFCI
jgi:hypothetical protein